MRPFSSRLLIATLTTLISLPVPALASDLTVRAQNRYIDTYTFNSVISNTPQVQVETNITLPEQVTAFAYAYTGFKKPFRDQSSEYGFGISKDWKIADSSILTTSVSRYADIEGKGWGTGVWIASVGVTAHKASVSVSSVSGAFNTVLMRGSYDITIGKRLVVQPSLDFYTHDKHLNPAMVASYSLTSHVVLSGKCVFPKKDDSSKHGLYGALALAYRF